MGREGQGRTDQVAAYNLDTRLLHHPRPQAMAVLEAAGMLRTGEREALLALSQRAAAAAAAAEEEAGGGDGGGEEAPEDFLCAIMSTIMKASGRGVG